MSRKLASIQLIEAIYPIEGADAIEKAVVMGWNVVVKKGEFKSGDSCVFFEIDSLLPEGEPWAEFMRPRKFRVKTVKLRGVLSQGLALSSDIAGSFFGVGDDVTGFLGVKKYEPPEPVGADIIGSFVPHVPKTDEIRVQSVLGVLNELKGSPFYITEKLDGTSGTFAKLDGEYWICSRNNRVREFGHFGNVSKRYEMEKVLPDGFAVQGEICGPGIQKNRLNIPKHDFFVFDVFDIRKGEYMGLDDMKSFCSGAKLKTVRILMEMSEFYMSLNDLLDYASGTYTGTSNRREGIVVRSTENVRSATLGGRLSFKVLNNEFLLKDER
jgi:RNA ligase (TIGR02306 family)